MDDATDPVQVARRIADEVLLPDAAEVDRADRVPGRQLRLLAESGLFGLAASDADAATAFDVTAALAGGSLATAFVWLQHQGALRAAAGGAGVGPAVAADLAAGTRIGGVAITALRPPAPLRTASTDQGFTLIGGVPWVTGWGIADVLLVAAIDGEDVRYLLVDAVDARTIQTAPADLIAARASRTVTLRFDRHPVARDRLVRTTPLAAVQAADPAGLGLNGALAIGVARRSLHLAGVTDLDAELAAARQALLDGTGDTLPDARARASLLAVRAATRLTIRTGSGSVIRPNDAERLLREAQFLLTFGSRPSIRAALEARFADAD